MPIVPSYSPKRGNYLEDLRNRIEQLEPSQSLSNIPVLNVPSPPTRFPQPMGVESIITPTQRLKRNPRQIPLTPPPRPITPQPQPVLLPKRQRQPRFSSPEQQIPTIPPPTPPPGFQPRFTSSLPNQPFQQKSLSEPQPEPTLQPGFLPKYSAMDIPKLPTWSELLESISSTPAEPTPQTSRESLYSRRTPQPFDPSPQGFSLPPTDWSKMTKPTIPPYLARPRENNQNILFHHHHRNSLFHYHRK